MLVLQTDKYRSILLLFLQVTGNNSKGVVTGGWKKKKEQQQRTTWEVYCMGLLDIFPSLAS